MERHDRQTPGHHRPGIRCGWRDGCSDLCPGSGTRDRYQGWRAQRGRQWGLRPGAHARPFADEIGARWSRRTNGLGWARHRAPRRRSRDPGARTCDSRRIYFNNRGSGFDPGRGYWISLAEVRFNGRQSPIGRACDRRWRIRPGKRRSEPGAVLGAAGRRR